METTVPQGETERHIAAVKMLMTEMLTYMAMKAIDHDASKLQSPEKEAFDLNTPKLKATKFGTPEYEAVKASMKPALDHHYANNSHHPEHYPEGIRGMNLMDLVEMVCDWKASSIRTPDSDIMANIETLQKRFGYSDDLKQIIINTVKWLDQKYPQKDLRVLFGPRD